jgi:pentose-5-phosphate-3-epimerase
MTVNPGYSGQKLVPWGIESIAVAREIRESGGFDYLIQVDGNVSWQHIPKMIQAGADVLVAGTSSLFDPAMTRTDAMAKLKKLVSVAS